MVIHVVQAGETVNSIAEQYGVSVQRLIYDNQLQEQLQGQPQLQGDLQGGARRQALAVGQALLVLFPRVVHTVEAGDTLEQIAARYGTTVLALARNNPFLLQQNVLLAGQQIVVFYEEERLGSMRVNGYAYPFIAPAILREALLYLDELLVFSYGFTFSGELVPPRTNEDWMLEEAGRFGVESILVLTPFAEPDVFNNQLVKTVTQDLKVQQTLIQNLLAKVQEKGYMGVDVDFEYILPEDREAYAQFVANLNEVMTAQGYRVSVALAPKTSATQPGLLYEGMDYRLLGENADSVFLMAYEWGYTYGPPMAVAPLNKVEQVVDYALTEIPAEKIVMGIPNYAYDWPLPFVRGTTAARNISNVEAPQLAARAGAEILFDEVARSPHFTYWMGDVQHEVWFEDVRSVEAKVRLAFGKNLLGIGYWSLMKPFRANWLVLNALIDLG